MATTSMFDTTDPACPGYYAPEETAVLLLDFHQMFVDKLCWKRGPECASNANRFLHWVKNQDIKILHCLLDLEARPLPTCRNGARLAASVDLMKELDAADEVSFSELANHENTTFLRRIGTLSALKSAGLEQYLDTQGIKSLLLMGLTTSGCVMRTSLDVTDAGFVTTVIKDGCADGTREAHDIAVKHLLPNRGWVTDSHNFIAGYDSGTGSRGPSSTMQSESVSN